MTCDHYQMASQLENRLVVVMRKRSFLPYDRWHLATTYA